MSLRHFGETCIRSLGYVTIFTAEALDHRWLVLRLLSMARKQRTTFTCDLCDFEFSPECSSMGYELSRPHWGGHVEVKKTYDSYGNQSSIALDLCHGCQTRFNNSLKKKKGS